MNRKLFYSALTVAVAFTLYFLFAANNPTSRTNDPLEELAQQQQLLKRIATEYNYEPRKIEWGCKPNSDSSLSCGSALTLPDTAWNKLSESEKQLVIDYAKTQNQAAVIVGRIKDPQTIYLDREVWKKTN